MKNIDVQSLREAFGTFISGVSVVSAVSPTGTAVGFTASSFTSVSLDPPLLLVCPANTLTSIEIFKNCQHFALNILADNQQDISNIFASYEGDRFAQVSWRADAAGCPLIEDVTAWFSCTSHQCIPAGDHLMLVGRITDFAVSGLAGLGYSGGGYFSLGLERQAAELLSRNEAVNVGAIIEYDDHVLMVDTAQGWCPPQVKTRDHESAMTALSRFLSGAGLRVEIGPVYSIFESRRTGSFATYYRCLARSSHSGELGRYIAIDDLPHLNFASRAIRVMMQRYLLERHSGVFSEHGADETGRNAHTFNGDPPATS